MATDSNLETEDRCCAVCGQEARRTGCAALRVERTRVGTLWDDSTALHSLDVPPGPRVRRCQDAAESALQARGRFGVDQIDAVHLLDTWRAGDAGATSERKGGYARCAVCLRLRRFDGVSVFVDSMAYIV